MIDANFPLRDHIDSIHNSTLDMSFILLFDMTYGIF